MQIKRRQPNEQTYTLALAAGLSPLLAHIIACRLPDLTGDIQRIVSPGLRYIDHPDLLKDGAKAAKRIAAAIIRRERIGILTDYDVDGVTSHALIYRALTEYFGFPKDNIHSLIGHRIQDGYGVSERLTQRILANAILPELIITADCGSSDEARIACLQKAGIDVIVTDHHALPLAGPPPSAYAVVNPTRSDCRYPDTTIAGCMTAWLLMSQVRSQLIEQGYLSSAAPKLARELDYVGLGTIADCVSIGTAINRAVVAIGLGYLNRFTRPCWRAIRTLLNRGQQPLTVEDLSFQLGPRINARSRLADPYAALKYLLADNDQDAMDYLTLLNADNQERKGIERDMVETAKLEAGRQVEQGCATLVVYLNDGHAGVQGIVASRLVEAFGRPAIVFCNTTEPGQLTGSARSIAELHMRDALQQVADTHTDVFVKFGGHRGAAGLTVYHARLPDFREAFEQAVRGQLGDITLGPAIWTDGNLSAEAISLATVVELEQLQPFGREFEAPVFEGTFTVETVRVVGAEAVHLALTLSTPAKLYSAIWFRALPAPSAPLPVATGNTVHCAYRLSCDEFRGVQRLRLVLAYARQVLEPETVI